MSTGYEPVLVGGGGDGGEEDDEDGGFFRAEPEDDPIAIRPEPLLSVVRDWNEEFQVLLQHTLSDSETEVERAARLRQLCHGERCDAPDLCACLSSEHLIRLVQFISHLFIPSHNPHSPSVLRISNACM